MVKVPALVGHPVAYAKSVLAKSGLRLSQVGRIASKYPEDTVAQQSPSANEVVRQGSVVSVWVAEVPPAKPPDLVKVPDLGNRDVKEAAAILSRTGLRLGDVSPVPSDAPIGTVLRQAPSPGKAVTRDTRVGVWVAQGPLPKVPDVIGRPLKDADAILARSGFRLRDAGRIESKYPEGAIARQSPAAGEGAAKGAPVNVWISVGAVVSVPNLRGLSVEAANQRLREDRLRLGAQTPRPSLPPAGVVVDQKPTAGAEWKVGSPVDVAVGDGSQARVPALVGQTEGVALERLKAAGLLPGDRASEESARPKGEVLRQRPAQGSVVARGSAVAFSVATPEKVAVPMIIGLHADEALGKLEPLGLAGSRSGEEESARPQGEILRQEPAPGTRVLRGERVRFWVASPMLVTVPDLSGIREPDAAERLRADSLVAGRVERERSRIAEGLVIRQQPLAGERVPRGTAVDYWVASPVLVSVPRLVGVTTRDARARLSDLGLVMAERPPEDNDAPEGAIIAHEPPAGTLVPLSTEITVRVSAGPRLVSPLILGGGIGAALLVAGAGLWWARRGPRAPAPTAKPTVRVRMAEPDASVEGELALDSKAAVVSMRTRLMPGDSDVSAEKLVVREERGES